MMGFDDAASGAVGLATSIASGIQQAQANADRARQMERILAMYRQMGTPTLDKMSPILLGPSAEANVHSDPALQLSQMQTLGQLGDEYSQGGRTSDDRAAMLLAQNEASSRAAAQDRALQAQLSARGLGSSGAAMSLRAGGARDANNTVAQTGMQSQVAARQRALSALSAKGNLAGDIRGQQFNERDRTAAARDQWNKYNTAATQDAQKYNLNLTQQDWNNKMRLNGAIAGATTGVADAEYQGAQQNTKNLAGLGQAGGEFAGQVAHDLSSPIQSRNQDDEYSYPQAPRKLY